MDPTFLCYVLFQAKPNSTELNASEKLSEISSLAMGMKFSDPPLGLSQNIMTLPCTGNPYNTACFDTSVSLSTNAKLQYFKTMPEQYLTKYLQS